MNETLEGTAVVVNNVSDEPTQEPRQELELRSAFDIKPQVFQAGLDRRKKNRKALISWIQEELVEGTDWGRIHVVKKEKCPHGRYCQDPYHFSKPSLWKAGAEKIVGMMGLRSDWPTLTQYEQMIMEGKTITMIMLRCELSNERGAVVSAGIGARALQADYGDLNKAFKMAKKSSLIDATLNLAGLSEIFTQDVEDMDPDKVGNGAPDPYNKHEEQSDNVFPREHGHRIATHCPIGKEWKGKPWEEVDDGFLRWIMKTVDDKPELVARAEQELGSRSVETDAAKQQRVDTRIEDVPGEKKLADYARELTLATNIDEVLQIKDMLPLQFEPGLRTFIATRERELGPK